jgi:hypothetical protein
MDYLILSIALACNPMPNGLSPSQTNVKHNTAWIRSQINSFLVTHLDFQGSSKTTIESILGKPDGHNIDAEGSALHLLEDWREEAVYRDPHILITYDGYGRCLAITRGLRK